MEILHMATRCGAEILGLECGIVAPGKLADLIAFQVMDSPDNWADVPFEQNRKKLA